MNIKDIRKHWGHIYTLEISIHDRIIRRMTDIYTP